MADLCQHNQFDSVGNYNPLSVRCQNYYWGFGPMCSEHNTEELRAEHARRKKLHDGKDPCPLSIGQMKLDWMRKNFPDNIMG